MVIKFIQRSVNEEINTKNWKGPDYRQTKAVLRYRPDIIIFEKANNNKTSDTIYNKYDCKNKPIKSVRKYQRWLQAKSKEYGDAESESPMWDNIMKLWSEDHNVLLYNADGSDELRREFFEVWKYMYPCALKNWLWWVRIYLREKYMAKNIKWILEKNKDKKNLTVAIFLQKFHWEHVQFLLKDPTKKQIWDYYFKNFKGITRSNITEKIKKENKVFYKYWEKISDFC